MHPSARDALRRLDSARPAKTSQEEGDAYESLYPGHHRSKSFRAADRQRRTRRSLDQVIEIVEAGELSPEDLTRLAKLRRLLNDLDLPEAD